MNKPNNINEKQTLNSLENLSDEELVDLKNQAIADEDYDKAKEIKQEQERRKGLSIEQEKNSYNSEKHTRLQELLITLNNNDDKNIEISESMEQDFEKICKIFKNKAIFVSNLIDDNSSDEFRYQRGQDLYNFLKNFCSEYSHDFEELDNNKTIKKLGLTESFNNIYRRCLMISYAYFDGLISGDSYFYKMYDMFSDLEFTIRQSKEPGFYREGDGRNMPTL